MNTGLFVHPYLASQYSASDKASIVLTVASSQSFSFVGAKIGIEVASWGQRAIGRRASSVRIIRLTFHFTSPLT